MFVENELLKMAATKQDLRAKNDASRKRVENKLQIELTVIDEKIDRLVDFLACGNEASTEIVNNKLTELSGARRDIISQISALSTSDVSESEVVQVGDLPSVWNSFSMEQKREIAGAFIKKIQYTPEKTVITWKYGFEG